MKLLEVLLKEVTIFQDTDWEKKGLDWNEFPDEFVRINPTNRVSKENNTVNDITAKLNAWRKANPRGRPEAAWTALGGSGPAPEPVKTIKGRDLNRQPPDDSGDWIDFGDKWQNTKMTPTGFALKPNPDRPNTWGTKWVPATEAIHKIKKANKGISDAEVTKQVKAINNSQGQPRYSDQEIADAWKTIDRFAILDKIQKGTTETPKRKWIPGKGWTCPDGWTYNKQTKTCDQVESDEDDNEETPEPDDGPDGNPVCPKGWKFDEKTGACVRDKTSTNNDTPPKPVKGSDGNFTCVAPWVYDEKTKSCVKKTETPVVVTPTPPKPVTGPDGKITCPDGWTYDESNKVCVKKTETPVVNPPNEKAAIIWPVGNESLITPGRKFKTGHPGIDIAVPYGTDIVAPEDGTITERKTQSGNPGENGAGLYMKLLSTDGHREHIFMHLSVSKSEGKSFNKGDVIGKSGGELREFTYVDNAGKTVTIPKEKDMRSGNADGAHLHWGVKVDGKPVDPLTLFK